MYKVVEFDSTHGSSGGISVVRTEWLTPLKKECLWPPYKLMAKFNRALQGGIVPDDKWTLHGIRRVFYETDDLTKARNKCRQAESESEVATKWEVHQGELRKKRKIRKITFDSDESENYEEQCINFPDAPSFEGTSTICAATQNINFPDAPSFEGTSTIRAATQNINFPDTPSFEGTSTIRAATPNIKVIEEYQHLLLR